MSMIYKSRCNSYREYRVILLSLISVWIIFYILFGRTSVSSDGVEDLQNAQDETVISNEELGDLDLISIEDIRNGSLNGYNQTDPRILRYILKHHLVPPQTGPYNLTPLDPNVNKIWTAPAPQYVHQLLRYKRNGFFIECGANDGEFLSNTLQLEKTFEWTGLLVEADPQPLKLIYNRNRRAWVANVCLAVEPYPHMVEMSSHKAWTGLSLIRKYDVDGRYNADFNITFQATCFPLLSILSALNVTVVDYFSLDIEGAELAVLKTFPFDGSILIKVISVEVNAGSDTAKGIEEYLTSKDYRLMKYMVGPYVHDAIYVHKSLPPLE